MKKVLLSILFTVLTVSGFAQETNSMEPCSHSKYISDLGLAFPINTDNLKSYINSNSIEVGPLTSGFGAGFQFGRHKVLNDKATLGIVTGGNMFIVSTNTTNQVYQLGIYLTGRLYFGETWKNGVFAEVGAGPEFGGAIIQDGPFKFQGNFASRFGLGYNYQFSKDVTLGISAIVSPSLTSSNYFDGSRIVVNMLW